MDTTDVYKFKLCKQDIFKSIKTEIDDDNVAAIFIDIFNRFNLDQPPDHNLHDITCSHWFTKVSPTY